MILVLFSALVFWPQGMWDLSSPAGIEPVPPALEGEVLTTGPPGKPRVLLFDLEQGRIAVHFTRGGLEIGVLLLDSALLMILARGIAF